MSIVVICDDGVKVGRASVTASVVAFARAVASAPPMTAPALEDRSSESFLPPVVRALVPTTSFGQRVARVAGLGLVDHIALRTAAIDAALDAVFPQVVLLGAGLDMRGYRLPALEQSRVFEVDHPASQALKRSGTERLAPRCRSLVHVPADFISDDLDMVLREHGHDAERGTAWVLEGVTPYLTENVTRRVLSVVAQRSAPESLLIATYMRPPNHPLPPLLRAAFDFGLHLVGEPLGAAFTPASFAALLRQAGLELRSDTCSRDWAARFGASALLARPFQAERLVLAAPR